MTYRIVNTDNFGGDYPDETFVDGEFHTKDGAQCMANALNEGTPMSGPRYFKVVEMPYELVPGFACQIGRLLQRMFPVMRRVV